MCGNPGVVLRPKNQGHPRKCMDHRGTLNSTIMFETEDTKTHLQIPDTSWTLLQSSSCFSTCTCMSTLQKLFIVIYTVHHTPLLKQKTSTVKLHGFESAEIVVESNQSGNSVSNAARMCKKKLAARHHGLAAPLQPLRATGAKCFVAMWQRRGPATKAATA